MYLSVALGKTNFPSVHTKYFCSKFHPNLSPPSLLAVPVVVGFNAERYTVTEAEGPLQLTVNLTSPDLVRRNVTVSVHTERGTASERERERERERE